MNRTLREKIIVAGPQLLSDEELLCAVMQTDPSDDSMRIAAELITQAGSLSEAAQTPAARLRKTAGCGIVRAARIAASAELARRIRTQQARQVQNITCSNDVLQIFSPLADLPHEEFWVLFLSTSGRIIDKMKVSQGGVSGTVVDYRLIVKQAVMLLADSMILVHNHPSGSPEASRQDYEVTERIRQAAALFDIRLLDHIVISRSGHFSMSAEGRL